MHAHGTRFVRVPVTCVDVLPQYNDDIHIHDVVRLPWVMLMTIPTIGENEPVTVVVTA
jgi:hypothetical protein